MNLLEQRIVQKLNLQEVDTATFYRTVFPKGSLEETGNTRSGKYGKYNAMVHAVLPDGVNEHILCVHDDLTLLEEIRVDNAYMNCISYIGKEPDLWNARELFAFFVYVNAPSESQEIEVFLNELQGYLEFGVLSKKNHELVDEKHRWGYSKNWTMAFIKPTYLLMDNGQLYFCFVTERPIPLFENYATKMQAIYNEMSKKINQGLRLAAPRPQHIALERTVVGKNGCRAYRLPQEEIHRISIDELNSCVAERKRLRIREIKEWNNKPELFAWFLRIVRENANNPNLKPRVFAAVASYAVKSSISKGELQAALDALSVDLSHLFSAEEIDIQIDDAWYFYNNHSFWLHRWSIAYINEICGLEIKENKRTRGLQHKNRTEHCRDINKKRKVEKEVLAWMAQHADATQNECAEALGISQSTVSKWTKKAKEMQAQAAARQQEPKTIRKTPVCKVCGCELETRYGEVRFHQETGNYRQKMSSFCNNRQCKEFRKIVTSRYRIHEDYFQELHRAHPVFVHIYGNKKEDPSTQAVDNVGTRIDCDDHAFCDNSDLPF